MKIEVVEFGDNYYGVRRDTAPWWLRMFARHSFSYLDLEDREPHWRPLTSQFFSTCCRTKNRQACLFKALSLSDTGEPIANVHINPNDFEIM